MVLPFEQQIEIVCPVGAYFGAENRYLQNMPEDFFERLAVPFIQPQQEKGQHDEHHTKGSGPDARRFFQQEEKRDAKKRAAAHADELPFGEIEKDLGFDMGKVFGDRDVSDDGSSFRSVSVENGFAEAAGL